jgi:hypothetical protein
MVANIENIAKCKDMPYGRSAEIGNSKWPPRAYSSPW